MRNATLLASIATLSLIGATAITSAQSVNQGSAKGTEAPSAATPKGDTSQASPPAAKPAQTTSVTVTMPPRKKDIRLAPEASTPKPRVGRLSWS